MSPTAIQSTDSSINHIINQTRKLSVPPATIRAPREIATSLALEVATPLDLEKTTRPNVATPPLASSPAQSGLRPPINHVINQTCKTRELSAPPVTTRGPREVAGPLAPAVATALAFGPHLATPAPT